MNRRFESRLRRLEAKLLPMMLPAFIVGPRWEDRPEALNPGERVVIDYTDGGYVTWSWRITSDPDDHGQQKRVPGGYIDQCLRRRAVGDTSWPLPWAEDGITYDAQESSPIECDSTSPPEGVIDRRFIWCPPIDHDWRT